MRLQQLYNLEESVRLVEFEGRHRQFVLRLQCCKLTFDGGQAIALRRGPVHRASPP